MNGLDFPNWLQDQLDEKGWRPTTLAKQAHVSDGAVSRILSGARKPDPETLKAFAKALKIPPEQAFRAAGQLPPGADRDPWVDEMTHKLSLLSPRVRDIAGKIINALAEGEGEPNNKPKSKPKSITP